MYFRICCYLSVFRDEMIQKVLCISPEWPFHLLLFFFVGGCDMKSFMLYIIGQIFKSRP